MLSRQFWFVAVPFTMLSVAPLLPAQSSAEAASSRVAAPAMQLPPDQVAFKRANTLADNQQRAAALQAFLHDYPKSGRVGRARSIVLQLLLQQQPRDEQRIHQVAKSIVDSADKDSRTDEENSTAYALAEALPNGADLKSAEAWAKDAVKQTTEQKFDAQVTKSYLDAKEPAPSAATLHKFFAHEQAGNLQTLADVYLHEGKLPEATAAVQQGQQLDPTEGANFATLGQIEHAEHQDDKAENDLITASIYGGMTPVSKELLESLYAAQHGGSLTGLEAEIDSRYHALFKPTAPAAPPASTSGRTVLLSLFTGAACGPCVAADLALDDVLAAYPRTEVVALAFDQHIPAPDPLANPSTVARADYDKVHFTPTFRIDGVEGPNVGGHERSDVGKSYKEIASAIDKQLAIPAGVSLHLTANLTAAHAVDASAKVDVTDPEALRKLLASRPATKASADKADAKKTASPPDTAAAKEPRLVVNFALVQREVSYSGENGIRFHSMVVRDLARPSAEAFPVQLNGMSSASCSFDPAAISASLGKYLDDFSQHSERFGVVRFLSTDTALPLDDLAVAAWVEDLSTHQVVTAAYAPLSDAPAERAAR